MKTNIIFKNQSNRLNKSYKQLLLQNISYLIIWIIAENIWKVSIWTGLNNIIQLLPDFHVIFTHE